MSDTTEKLMDHRILIGLKFAPRGIFEQILCVVLDALFTSNLIVMAKLTASFGEKVMVLICCAAMRCDAPAGALAFHLECIKKEGERRQKFEDHVKENAMTVDGEFTRIISHQIVVSREAKIIGLDSIVIKSVYQTKEFNTQMQVLDRRNHTGPNPSNTSRSHTNILMDEQHHLIVEATETDTGPGWDLPEMWTKFNSSPRIVFEKEKSNSLHNQFFTDSLLWWGGKSLIALNKNLCVKTENTLFDPSGSGVKLQRLSSTIRSSMLEWTRSSKKASTTISPTAGTKRQYT